MSLEGSLEHVRAVDVVQFIHIGRRTGTLKIRNPPSEAVLGFREGQLINATLTGAPRLGELLILAGLLSPSDLESTLAIQQGQHPRRSLGKLLLDQGLVPDGQITQLLAQHFANVVLEVVSWRQGSFEFTLDDLWPVEELKAFPGDTAVHVEVDTRAVLMEALGQVDRLSRQAGGRAAARDETGAGAAPGELREGAREPAPAPVRLPPQSPAAAADPGPDDDRHTLPRVQVLSRDGGLAERLCAELREERTRVTTVTARDAGFSLPGEPPPIVLADLRDGAFDVDAIRTLRRGRPRASVVAYCLAQIGQAPLYDAGAVATVHGEVPAVAACIRSVCRSRAEQSNEALIARGLSEGFARLRKVVSDLRSGMLGTTVSLNLLTAIADSIERAILFVVEEEQLIPVGSFGLPVPTDKQPALNRSLRLSLRDRSVFGACAESDRPQIVPYEEATLPGPFRAVVNRPRSGLCAVFPVSGSQRVIAMIYADNGANDRPMADVQLLGLALSQLGLALENELLRRARDAYRQSAQDPGSR